MGCLPFAFPYNARHLELGLTRRRERLFPTNRTSCTREIHSVVFRTARRPLTLAYAGRDEMPDDRITAWCRSCGLTAYGASCTACGISLAAPEPGAAHVGTVVKVSGGLLSKFGVVLPPEGDGSMNVLVKGSSPSGVSAEDFSKMEVQSSSMSLTSAAGRLLGANADSDLKAVKGKWERSTVREIALQLAGKDMGSRRAAAMDFLELTDSEAFESLELSVTEKMWIRGLYAAERGDLEQAVARFEELSAPSYAARVDVLFALAVPLLGATDLHKRVCAILEPFGPESIKARALLAALGTATWNARVTAAKEIANTLFTADSRDSEEFTRLIDGLAEGVGARPTDPDALPITQALAVYRDGAAGHSIDADAGWLISAQLPLYDDLIDSGGLSAEGIENLKVLNAPWAYLVARLDAGRLNEDQLKSIDHVAELARRRYLAGDMAGLAALPDGPDVAHYRALLTLRNTGDCDREALRPRARELLTSIDLYRVRLEEGNAGLPPSEVLEDPSSWRALYPEARTGKIKITPVEREKWPEFASWLDLCEIQSCVFAKDWTSVRDLSSRLIGQVQLERIRDEVHNMAAYAEYQMGNFSAAMDHLTSALEGDRTEGLVVNASIVASELGSEYAAEYLARVYNEAETPTVGVRALQKGISLWLQDPDTDTPPVTLVTAIRSALARPMGDDAFLSMVRFVEAWDTEWLASAPPISAATSVQKDVVLYFEIAARAGLQQYSESLVDMTKKLVEFNQRPSVEEWARRELERLVDRFMAWVHVPFGEGAYLASAIDVLMSSSMLTLPQRLILGPQAGAHLAVHFQEERKGTLMPADEKAYFFDSIEMFLADKTQLPDGAREWVGEELTRCLLIAQQALVIVTSEQFDEFASTWDALVARERWDQQNRTTILRQERSILQSMSNMVDRCALYDQQNRRLPLNADQKDHLRDMRHQIDEWKNLIARLGSYL